MQIQRLGHSMFKIITEEGKVIVVDPWISDNPSCPKEWQNISRWSDIDLVLCTHAHFDHSMDLEKFLDVNDHVTGIIHFEHFVQAFMGSRKNLIPLNFGGTLSFDNVRITLVPANHTSSTGNGPDYRSYGMGSGFLIVLETGFTIYISGDTCFMSEMKTLIGDFYKPDMAVLSIGGIYCMNFAEAAYSASLIGARYNIPCEWFPKIDDIPDPAGFSRFIEAHPAVRDMLDLGKDFLSEMRKYRGIEALVLDLGDSFSPPKEYQPRSRS